MRGNHSLFQSALMVSMKIRLDLIGFAQVRGVYESIHVKYVVEMGCFYLCRQ